LRFRLALPLFVLAALLPRACAWGAEYFAQEKCSLCHIRQSVFFDPKFAGPERLKEFDEERLCASCHNGSVRDSRVELWRGSQHPSPVPGEKANGKRCSRCHSPHAKGGWDVMAGTSVNLWKGGDALCAGCHKRYSSTTGSVHGNGFTEGGCKECHRVHGGVGRSLLREQREILCLRCHASVAAERGGGHPLSVPSMKAKTGKDLPGCTECHPPHRDEESKESLMGRCAGCHDYGKKGIGGSARKHPGGENCLECHSFHSRSGEGGKKFRGREISADLLCGRCHESYRADSTKKGKEKGTHVTVLSGGKEELCFRCHKIHQGIPGTALLISGKAYSCLACHEKQNTIRETGGIDLAHPVFERVAKGRLDKAQQSKKLPLGPAGEIICATCHDVHKAAPDTPLLAPGAERSESCFWCHEEMRGKRHAPRSEAGKRVGCDACHPIHGKRKLGNDPWRNVCTGCHSKGDAHRPGRVDGAKGRPKEMPGFDARGRKVAIGQISCPTCHEPHGTPGREKAIRRQYSSSAFLCTACHEDREDIVLTPHDLRGIAGKSICEPCHIPHGGKSPWMWGFDSRIVETGEDACRSCHKEKGMGIPIPHGGHPVNMIVSRPLPDNFPLADTSGARQKSGVLSCPTCHEVHGMGIFPTGKGAGKLLRGDCLSCHSGKETAHGKADCGKCHPPHRKSDAAYLCGTCHAEGTGGMARFHALAGKGCGSCHAIHTTKKATEKSEERCTSCHARAARIIGTPHSEMVEGACRSCHPAHRDPESAQPRKRAWEETLSADLPCLNCHREDGPGPVAKWMDHPKTRQKVPTSYGATVSLESPIIMMGRLQEAGRPLFPLFDEKGKPVMSGRMGCLTCHDPHAGTMIKGEDGKRIAGGYLRDPSGVFLSDVCAPCHRGESAEHARKFHELPRKTD